MAKQFQKQAEEFTKNFWKIESFHYERRKSNACVFEDIK